MSRLGVACKWVLPDGRPDPAYHFMGLTRELYLRKGHERLVEVAHNNARVLHAVVCMLGNGPVRNRMFRIGNDVLPCLTLPEARRSWRSRPFLRELGDAYAAVGRRARADGVRLSTHPSQFVVPNSTRAHVRRNSIADLDAWAMWVRAMGMDESFCLNVHLGPNLDGTRDALIRSWRIALREMSADARRYLTVENNDRQWNIADLLFVSRACGLRPVVDVHHHWCVTGVWPDPHALGRAVVPLWNGVRPKVHLSLPRGRYFSRSGLDDRGLPRLDCLTDRPDLHESAQSRPHALLPWAPGTGRYVRDLLDWADVMVEIKGKNLARDALWAQIDALPRRREHGRSS